MSGEIIENLTVVVLLIAFMVFIYKIVELSEKK